MHTKRLTAAFKLEDLYLFLLLKLSYFNEVHTKYHIRCSKAATTKYTPCYRPQTR